LNIQERIAAINRKMLLKTISVRRVQNKLNESLNRQPSSPLNDGKCNKKKRKAFVQRKVKFGLDFGRIAIPKLSE